MPTVPARSYAFQHLRKGEAIKVIQTHGRQVVDTWAFAQPNGTDGSNGRPPAHMSMAQTRVFNYRLFPKLGQDFRDTRRAPILTLEEDTSPGVHDALFSACSPERYVILGAGKDHDSCAMNLLAGLKAAGEPHLLKAAELVEAGWVPDPLNLFMNVPVLSTETYEIECISPVSRPGDYVVLRAVKDCTIVMSACPMDLNDCNGGKTSSADYEVLPAV
ncbi:hypothetical protein K4F52_006224 [Lecanicillium sp. MT-2017a]|nr:hypothetical protein K4F52_006224 [Lecanicillium sp. MT-2017a]